jgi:cytochrome c oxidase subunit 4
MSSHVVPTRVYFAIFLALMVLTAMTVAVAYVDLGVFNNVVALAIACTKAALVVLYFMHVRYSDHLVKLSILIGILFLMILFGFTLADPLTRQWVRPIQYIW